MNVCVHFATLLQIIRAVESRVYCQDSHASSWVPFGYSCPVLCQNIINAIERLKIMDFENIIYKKKSYTIPERVSLNEMSNSKIEDIKNEIDSNESSKDNTVVRTKVFMNRRRNYKSAILNGKEHKDNYFSNNNTIDEKSFYKDVIKLSQLASKTFMGRCNESKKTGLVALMKCARKSNIDGSFLIIMTKLLNKYANSVYKFTEEMTEVLLEKILGENTDLRNNIFDVNKLLGYLRQALHRHRKHENHDVIALGSQNCLTLSLPGCFCKPGFVESSGQCVKPSDCVSEASYDEYLARLIVT